MKNFNWRLLLVVFCLLLGWIFFWYVICQFIILQGHLEIYNANKDWETVQEIKHYEYKIAMFREQYWCPVSSGVCNTIVEIADKYGVDGQAIINLGWCESRLRPIEGRIDPRDRGWFQINSHYHPQITDECAYDLECSANYTALLISQGKGYLWNCWK